MHQSCCIQKTLFPWCPSPSLALRIFLSSLQHGTEGEEFGGDISIKSECSKVMHSACHPVLGLSFSSHFLQEGALLMMAEWDTDRWV